MIRVVDKLPDTMAIIVHKRFFRRAKIAVIKCMDLRIPLCVLPNDHPDVLIKIDDETICVTPRVIKELNCDVDHLEVKFFSEDLFVYGTLLPKWITPDGRIGYCWDEELRKYSRVRAILEGYELIYNSLPYACRVQDKKILGTVYLGAIERGIKEINCIEAGAGYKIRKLEVIIAENYPMKRKMGCRAYIYPHKVKGRGIFTMLYGDAFYSNGSFYHYVYEDHMIYLEGNYPLLITAPHGGYWRPINYPARHSDAEADEETYELTREIIRNIYELSNNRIVPYSVLGRIHRSRVDLNREKEAIRSTIARRYHERIRNYLSRLGKLILLDIHGMRIDRPYDIELGTVCGETVKGMEEILENFRKALIKQGFSVVVDKELIGEYTVRHYGESRNITAIQVEINKRHRTILNYPETARKIAKAILETISYLNFPNKF